MRPADRHARHLDWPLDYHGWAARPASRRGFQGVGVRVAEATAAAATLACLLVAVPCLVCAVVGVFFNDASASSAAAMAVVYGGGAILAGTSTVLCHRHIIRVEAGPIVRGFWN